MLDRLNDARECLDVTVETHPRDRNEYLIVSRPVTTPNIKIIIIDDVKLAHRCLPLKGRLSWRPRHGAVSELFWVGRRMGPLLHDGPRRP